MNRRSHPAALLALALLTLAQGARAAGKVPVYAGFVPGTEKVVVAYEQGPVLLLAVPELEVVRRFDGASADRLEGVAVSGNGAWLAADYVGAGVKVWDLETGDVKLDIARARPRVAPSLLFHPHDDLLLVYQDEKLTRWHVAEGRQGEPVRPVELVSKMSISPDGRYLAVHGKCWRGDYWHTLCVYLLEDDLVLSAVDASRYFGRHGDNLRDLALTENNRVVAEGDFQRGLTFGSHRLFLSLADLRETDSGGWSTDMRLRIPALRSGPYRRSTGTSSDGRWRVGVDEEAQELRLEKREAVGAEKPRFEIAKAVPLP